MKPPWKHLLFALLITALLVGGYYRRRQLATELANQHEKSPPVSQHFQESIEVMGTVASVQFYEEDKALNRRAADAVWKSFNEFNARFSNYVKTSELSALNSTAFQRPFVCTPEMWAMLRYSREAYEVSHGAFDISAGPLVRLWGMYRKQKKSLPTQQEIAAAKAMVGLNKVVFDDEAKTVRFTVEGMYLDVGGIAKGVALDAAVKEVRKLGIKKGIIDLGGNLLCMEDAPANRETYTIGVRNPFYPRQPHIGAIPMLNQAIATSGNYERFITIDGKRYAHIIDTRTGLPVTGMASVTVVASKGVTTDMLSTSIFINKGRYLHELKRRYPDIHVLVIAKQEGGATRVTKFPDGKLWEGIPDSKDWE